MLPRHPPRTKESHVDREATGAQVRLLGDLLGRTIADIEGDDKLELVERIRSLSIAHRGNGADAGPQLHELLRSISVGDASIVVTAFASWFHLVNLAEDQALVRQLIRDRTAAAEKGQAFGCLLYTSDAADDLLCVDLG